MPSSHRLHPVSILFGVGDQLREFAFPVVILLFTAGSAGWDWQGWTMLLAIPYVGLSIGRYISYRYRFEPKEMVIHTGIIFRNERHVPYDRIQNLDAVQNVLHRLLDVVEVRVQTGAGQEPEATMRVIPLAALEEMRRHVFADRGHNASGGEAVSSVSPDPPPLVRLGLGELMLFGLIENRGFVLIAGALGVLWEVGLGDRLAGRFFGERSGRGMIRELVTAFFSGDHLPLGRIALTLAAFGGVLLVIRVVSMVWAAVHMYGFTVRRTGDDLRVEFGLFTRVASTIPVRRIQTVSIRETPLHSVFGRSSIRVRTAGGTAEEGGSPQREWLAPIVDRRRVAELVRQVFPDLDLSQTTWEGVHPRAFRREVKGWAVIAVAASTLSGLVLRWWALLVLPALVICAWRQARCHVAGLGWALTDKVILFRSGCLWKTMSVAPFNRVQVVTLQESPFDRRTGMAGVSVDTAGSKSGAPGAEISYLARETAGKLFDRLSAEAASTDFRW